MVSIGRMMKWKRRPLFSLNGCLDSSHLSQLYIATLIAETAVLHSSTAQSAFHHTNSGDPLLSLYDTLTIPASTAITAGHLVNATQ